MKTRTQERKRVESTTREKLCFPGHRLADKLSSEAESTQRGCTRISETRARHLRNKTSAKEEANGFPTKNAISYCVEGRSQELERKRETVRLDERQESMPIDPDGRVVSLGSRQCDGVRVAHTKGEGPNRIKELDCRFRVRYNGKV